MCSAASSANHSGEIGCCQVCVCVWREAIHLSAYYSAAASCICRTEINRNDSRKDSVGEKIKC